MDVREKFVELQSIITCPNAICNFCEHFENKSACEQHKKEVIADNMIAHGVTVQKWIPVTERLPDRDGWYITKTNATGRSNGTLPQEFEIRNGGGRWRYRDRLSPWNITHWQPMPQPPKGE